MNRRELLVVSAGATSFLAGCTGDGSDDGVSDTDGDGVVDSQDYAPKDPEVQEKSDVVATETVTPTPTSTETRTPSPTPTDTPTPSPTRTPTPQPESNTLEVDSAYWDGQSHIERFSATSVTVTVDPDEPSTAPDEVRVYAALFEFPRADTVTEELSADVDRTDGDQRVTVQFEDVDFRTETSYHHFVGLVPADAAVDDISPDELTTVMESDPFEFTDDYAEIERVSYSGALDDDSGSSFDRQSVEGAYDLSVSGRTAGQDWTVSFFAWKSAHAQGKERSRGRSRPEYVSYELTEGTASKLATLLDGDADELGFTGRTKVEFVIDFVQALPYVPDDVSTGFDDYTKFIIETLPEMGGDCEDTAIMVASLLETDVFNYDMILIQPPGHMAAGIYDENPSGYYWEVGDRKYSYIETTGEGWGIGDLPDEYVGTSAYTYQV